MSCPQAVVVLSHALGGIVFATSLTAAMTAVGSPCLVITHFFGRDGEGDLEGTDRSTDADPTEGRASRVVAPSAGTIFALA